MDLSCLNLQPADLIALQARLFVVGHVNPAAPATGRSQSRYRNPPLPPPPLPPLSVVPAFPPIANVVVIHDAGPMDQVCPHCAARFYRHESQFCCTHGAVVLPLWRAPPEPLLSYLLEDDFRLKIRAYNCALSLGSSVFSDMTAGSGPACFKMSGRSWHLMPCAVQPSAAPRTAQIYALPVGDAANRRLEILSGSGRVPLRRLYLEALHDMLLATNSLVRSFLRSVADQGDWHVGCGALDPHATAANDSMIGLLINGGGERVSVIIPNHGNGSLTIVPDLDPYYQPIHFVLLFPYGEPQWGLHLDRAKSNARKRGRACAPVTIHDYLRFHAQRRGDAVCSIHSFGRLFEEWFVDCYLQNENQQLRYLQRNQAKFRREQFRRLQSELQAGAPARLIGSPATHLPSSFCRGSRHFRELYADAMTLPAKYGGIDYFVTFTTNPSWPEIAENSNLRNGMDSPDLYCRVFHIKMKALLSDILDNGVLGVCIAYTYSVEFQQRGLPHMHAVFIMRPEDKPHSVAIVDSRVSAQLPDAIAEPVYFAAVTRHMLHGPCGVYKPNHYCMKHGGVCRFGYPKRLCAETSIPADGYTQLARPVGPSFATGAFTFDNSWVVPHNKFLLCKYNAHINVEASASITVVKYMFSYIFKGSKATSTTVTNGNDEIQQFSDGRITSTAEAMWHVFRFESHSQSPTVIRLGCRLPEDTSVIFDPLDEPADIATATVAQTHRPTFLSAWFQLNIDDEFARTLTYIEVPTWYAWQAADCKWKRRITRVKVLGRLYPADPAAREAWAMRVLLLHSRGCQCSADIRTVYGEVRATFVEAAKVVGLIQDDHEFQLCLGSLLIRGSALRALLLIIVTKCAPSDPMRLIADNFDRLTEDFIGSLERKLVQLFNFIGSHIDVPFATLCLEPPTDFQRTSCTSLFLESFVSVPTECIGIMNAEQQMAHDAVFNSIHCSSGTIFALLAPAGTGKTFVINNMLATARDRGLRMVACATSGLAASLLGQSRTAHSTFKIPLDVDDETICKPPAAYKQWLQSIDCFIWDEISMAHRWAIEAVDRTLQDIRGRRCGCQFDAFVCASVRLPIFMIVQHSIRWCDHRFLRRHATAAAGAPLCQRSSGLLHQNVPMVAPNGNTAIVPKRARHH
jgi:hypothetical protein